MKNRSNTQWTRLDNAAKIFPPTTGKRDTKVFRLACELKEEINPEILQEALRLTILEFPLFQSVMKKGLFWYYFDLSEREHIVRVEDKSPCSPIYDNNKRKLLFDVTYYKSRINVEVYHALTDGTGALQFLRALVYHYLLLKHEDVLDKKTIQMDYDASRTQRMDDSFSRYYDDKQKPQVTEGKKSKRAYKLRGTKLSEYRLKVIEGTVSVKEIIEKAHDHNTTLTVFLVALLLCSIGEEMTVREKRRPVSIAVPVNLRNYFVSESARNFFGVMTVSYDFGKCSGELADVIQQVNECFKQELNKDKVSARMHRLGSLERNIFARITPLVFKDFFMKLAYEISELNYTFSASNVGNIKMPPELMEYIKLFDVFVSTKKQQMCMCSYGDNLNMSFTSCFVNAEIEKRFFRKLTDMGVGVKLVTNSGWEE